MTSMAILIWCQETQVEWHYIAPGKPPLGGALLACRARDAKWLWKNSPHKARLGTQDSPENWRELGSQVTGQSIFQRKTAPIVG